MMIKKYIGTVREEGYGYRTSNGYEPSLTLECEDGGSIPLGNSNYSNEFNGMVGMRIELRIEELEQVNED